MNKSPSPNISPKKEFEKKPGVLGQIFDHVAGVINEEGRVIEGIFLGKAAAAKEKDWIQRNKTNVGVAGSTARGLLSYTKEKEEEHERENLENVVKKLNLIGYDEKLKRYIDRVIKKKEQELVDIKNDFDVVKDEYDSLEKEIAYARIAFYNSDREDRAEKEALLEELKQKFAPVKASHDALKLSIKKLEKGSLARGTQEDMIGSMGIGELKKLSEQTKTAQATEYFFNIAKNKFSIPEENITRNKLGGIVSFRLGDEGIPFEKEMKKALDAYLANPANKN